MISVDSWWASKLLLTEQHWHSFWFDFAFHFQLFIHFKASLRNLLWDWGNFLYVLWGASFSFPLPVFLLNGEVVFVLVRVPLGRILRIKETDALDKLGNVNFTYLPYLALCGVSTTKFWDLVISFWMQRTVINMMYTVDKIIHREMESVHHKFDPELL